MDILKNIYPNSTGIGQDLIFLTSFNFCAKLMVL